LIDAYYLKLLVRILVQFHTVTYPSSFYVWPLPFISKTDGGAQDCVTHGYSSTEIRNSCSGLDLNKTERAGLGQFNIIMG